METDKQGLFLGRTADYLDVADLALKDPFFLQNTREGEQLDLLLEDKNQVLRRDEQVFAVNSLVDFLVCFVLHIKGVIGLDGIDDDFFGQLDCEPVFVDRDLFDVVSAPDLDSGLCDQVLDNDISHELSVGVSFLIKPMDTVELNRKVGN